LVGGDEFFAKQPLKINEEAGTPRLARSNDSQMIEALLCQIIMQRVFIASLHRFLNSRVLPRVFESSQVFDWDGFVRSKVLFLRDDLEMDLKLQKLVPAPRLHRMSCERSKLYALWSFRSRKECQTRP
jgi:hypothetical protein